jgi:alpha-D-ribose 1-methylphosphonate 5-triphosphate synthase subunit PhnH
MDATARPGTVIELPEPIAPPPPLSRGAAAVALTLCDQDTPVWLDAGFAATADVAFWLRFHTGAPIVAEPAQAAFAILRDPQHAPPFDVFALGTPEYPDRSATLILQVESLERGRSLRLTGPGVKHRNILCASPLPLDLPERLAANRALFPRGVDLLLVTDGAIAALPRSTVVSEEA